ncbi:HEAT repeat domain-containing protein [Parachlamydia sp. AcF125]|uniref:HEAT repeat domain-containing protein n=1 Tax=Parachlamydia sp. AcF125 TaxID=2795736 RepID=UPI001BCA18E5|nr:HEAT repeat domain-containing protein [Parachlamydia sp. AcF125]MBS4169138.1 hypothetical protein [Parachlamydia sp. AcF125]
MIMQVNPFIQYQGAVLPTRLAVGELNKRFKDLLQRKCPSCIKDLIAQGHKFLKEAEEEAALHGLFYLATAYELHCTLEIKEYQFDRQALDKGLDRLERSLKEGETLLHYFVAQENLSIFIYLFSQRPSIKSQLNDLAGELIEETPLHAAAKTGAISLVKFLLAQGADFKKLDSFQNNVLHHACQSEKDCIDIVKILLQYDYTLIEAKNSKGQLPLHLAASTGNEKIFEYLLGQITNKLQLDQQDREGNTPLHLVIMGWGEPPVKAEGSYCKITQALVKKGANLNILNHKKKTALALIFENEAIIQALVQANLSSQMLVSSLRNYYLSQETLSIFRIKAQQKWELKVPLEEIYVRLGVIENKERKTQDQALNECSECLQYTLIPSFKIIFKPKKEVEIEKLFELESLEKKARKRIFIQGAAGIGKSTLCHYISYHWAKGKLWTGMFTCLFRIPLRNLTLRKYPPDKEYTPADLIAKEYAGKVDRRVIEACINEPSFLQNTLLILDGYDELPADAQASTSLLATAFEQLKELFPHVIITSRPGSCSFDRSCELKLLGFDKEGIKRYVGRFFKHAQAKEKKQKLNRLLNTSPQVLSLVQIPINLTLLCCLFHEDTQVFDTKQPITMSAIYVRIVNWVYKWFLLRRIDQGQSRQTKEQILVEKNLRQNPEVANIATVFEEMAAFAMKNDTLYLSKPEIEDFKGNKILSNELTDCGLMSIPEADIEAEEKGYFIHLTFQEFLTASKVANQYLKGERQACQEFVRKYKFEPRYALVLRMMAGSLSLAASTNRRYADALQPFFDDLFAAPQDLAVRNEINLIAECFEECQDPRVVKQYDGFIELVKDYIKSICLLGLGFERLLRNKNLLNHPEIVRTITELLSDPQIRENTLNILISIVRLSLASEMVRLVVEVLKDSKKDSNAKRLATLALEEVARKGGELPKDALAALIQALKESNIETKGHAASALGAIAQQGGELSKEALTALIQALKADDSEAKDYAARALGAITQQGDELSKEALAALIQAFKEGDIKTKGYAASVLGVIAKQGGELSREVLDVLIKTLKEGDGGTKVFAVGVLREIAKQGGELSKEALAILIQMLKEKEKAFLAANALEVIVKQGGELSKEALTALIQALKEGADWAKRFVARALEAIAKQGDELPKEALVAFIQALKEGDDWTKRSAANALKVIAKQGSELPKEALAAFAQVLKEGDDWTKGSVANALEAIAKQGGELPKEALAAFIQALKEGDDWTKGYAIRALEAIAKQGGGLPKEALAAFIQALKEGDSEAKNWAARILVEIAKRGDELSKEALAILIQVFKAGDAQAKDYAASSLEVIAKQGGELSKEALAAFIQVLKEGDDWTKGYAIRALEAIAKQGGGLPKEALAAFIQALKEGDSEAKNWAARILVEIAKRGDELSKEALAILIQVFKAGDAQAKDYAASSLEVIAKQGGELSKEALAALIQALKEGDDLAKCSSANALEAIAKQGGELPKEALAALIQALKEGTSRIEGYPASVLRIVAQQGGELPKEVLAALIYTLKEGDDLTKCSSANALEAIAKQGSELPKEALAALIHALKKGDSRIKDSAARVLGTILKQGGELSKEALPALIQALKEGDSRIKDSVARVLGTILKQGGELPKEALVALIQALKEGDSRIKDSVARVLGTILKQGGELPKEALVALIQALKEGDSRIKDSVARVLGTILKQGGELPKEALVALIQALKAGNNRAKDFAVRALVAIAKQGGELSKEALTALIQAHKEGDDLIKDSVVHALKAIIKQGGGLSKEALAAFVQALKEGDDWTKHSSANALEAVAKQGGELSKEALAALIQALKESDDWTKGSVARILVEIVTSGGELSKEALIALIQALKEGYSYGVAMALKKIDKNALLKMSSEAFTLIAEICFFTESTFSVRDQKFQISDKRITYACEERLALTYEEIRERLPTKLAAWRERLDKLSPRGNFQISTDRA